jgi:DNA-binding transcriptional MerR regulator/methylmalonyl-CoA mutase cobalamin-binding subunit
MNTPPSPRLRIGELSRRTGVGADTLRAWERRYGLLHPERSEGGFRLYGPQDEQRVTGMKALIDSGVSAAEAARLALQSPPPGAAASPAPGQRAPEGRAERLCLGLEAFDEAEANAILDEALASLTVEAVADHFVLPAMRSIGERWESGEVTVAQEHFATVVLRSRMLSIGRNWGAGSGPRALLACPPGEDHDLGLVVFGVVLRNRGWRVTYLGPDTPIETIRETVAELRPEAIVIAALDPEPFERAASRLSELAGESRLLIGGAGAGPALAKRLGAELLDEDPVRAATELSPP